MFGEMAMDTTFPSTGGAILDGREATVLLLFIIWIPSSLSLTLRTTLDCAVYLSIYKNIRWRIHDLRVDTRGLYHLFFYYRGCHIYELFALGRKFLCQIALGRLFKILDIVRAVMEICMCV